MWWWLLSAAWAVEGVAYEPPALVRVEDPSYPGALARSRTGALLEAPPTTAGVRWGWETLAVPDGSPGAVTLDALNADLWHAAGYRGQGVRVAVFDIQWQLAEDLASEVGAETADCWAHSSCEVAMDPSVARFSYESGVHGAACAEVVHQVAPEAELFLVRVNGFTTLENAADWAIRNDIDVISMSMSFFNGSFYDGTGQYAELVERLAAHDVLLVSSSGNYARGHWSGQWRDVDGDRRMDFDGTNRLPLAFNGGARRSVFLNWDEHAACGLSDLDARIVDGQGDILGRSEDRQTFDADDCSPVERVSADIEEDGTYYLEVVGRRVMSVGLDVDVLTTNGSIPGGVRGYSIADPSAHPLTYVVGAVRADGYLTNDVEGFSSQGPVRAGILKPDIAGPNGLSVSPYGAEGFFGTSAATPAVAGALALVLSRDPDLSPYEAGDLLRGWALGDAPGWDPRWGAGRARLPVPEPEDDRGCGGGLLWAGMPWLLVPWVRRRSGVSPRLPRAPAAG